MIKKISKEVKLLKSLMDIPSPSGFELDMAKFIKKELLRYLPKKSVEIDFNNNVIATIKGTNPDKTVMIDAHLDEIGFIVTNVDREGLISIQYIGGGCKSILSARNLVILTNKGKINAVVDRTHAHLINDEDDETIGLISEAQVDIGIRKRKQVMKHVKIGDPVVYKSNFNHMIDNYYSGYGFDDKTGVFMLMEAIRQIRKSDRKPIPNLVFVFSAQEETGYSKVIPVVRKYKPQLFIELDVTFATDYGTGLEKIVGKCELGKGISIYRGVDIHSPSLGLMERTAKRNKIKYQIQASNGRGGTNAQEVTEFGIRALSMGVGVRSMHSPVEIVSMTDLKGGSKLLKSFLLNSRLGKVIEK